MTNFSKYSRRLLIAAGLVVSATGALAQNVTASANATANVIRPITLGSSVDLVFGNVAPTGGAATLALTAASPTVPTATAGLQPGTQAGTLTAAVFDVGGEGSFTYSITLPAGPATITGPAAATMTVDTFTKSAVSGTLGTLIGSAGSAGVQSFYVGGTLHVGATQTPGAYTGTFSVTVAYN